jgi:tRNA G18 (ribose-2'-O)-methylase SpoU
MLTHAQIQRLQGLRQKKFRHQYREIFVEGEKLVIEAVRAGAEVLQVLATPAWLDVYPPRPWLGDLPVMAVPEAQLEKVSGLETPPPVAAVVAMRPVRETLPDPTTGWVLALDQLSDRAFSFQLVPICGRFCPSREGFRHHAPPSGGLPKLARSGDGPGALPCFLAS